MGKRGTVINGRYPSLSFAEVLPGNLKWGTTLACLFVVHTLGNAKQLESEESAHHRYIYFVELHAFCKLKLHPNVTCETKFHFVFEH